MSIRTRNKTRNSLTPPTLTNRIQSHLSEESPHAAFHIQTAVSSTCARRDFIALAKRRVHTK